MAGLVRDQHGNIIAERWIDHVGTDGVQHSAHRLHFRSRSAVGQVNWQVAQQGLYRKVPCRVPVWPDDHAGTIIIKCLASPSRNASINELAQNPSALLDRGSAVLSRIANYLQKPMTNAIECLHYTTLSFVRLLTIPGFFIHRVLPQLDLLNPSSSLGLWQSVVQTRCIVGSETWAIRGSQESNEFGW